MSKLDEIRQRADSRLAALGVKTLSERGVESRAPRAKERLCALLDKDTLVRFDKGEMHFCPVLEAPFPVLACLARVFLAGHPRHKVCERCEEMDSYISPLLEVIDHGKK